ncbi:MAG: carboxylesterase family protein, partial [Panacibacter sp.]
NCLVASPLTKGLFIKAIAESGANFVSGPFGSRTLKQAEEQGMKTAQSVNASSLAALRNIPAAELLQKAQGTGPVIDGYVLPDAIANIFAEGKENKVTLLTGWNEDEGMAFGKPKTAEEFREQATKDYGAEAETFLKFYPATSDAEAAASQVNLSRDIIFGVQNYTWANAQSSKGTSKVFVYRFTRKVPATGEYVKFGAFHTGEVAYAYDNLKFVNRPWLPVDRELATLMSAYWVNFATKGNPNGARLPEWKAYDTITNSVMMLGEKCESKSLPDKASLDFMYSMITRK